MSLLCTSAVTAFFLAVATGFAWAQANDGPFATFDGVGFGNGTISLADGTKERIRCRNQYLVTKNATNLQQALRCSSDRYEFHVNTYVDADKAEHAFGKLDGDDAQHHRPTRGGRVDGSRIAISVGASGAFSATMTIVTSGSRQSVRIEAKGMDVTLVAVQLNKAK
jgi:hypothetical protein